MELIERFYGPILFVHVACAAIFTMTLIIMQTAVGPALARIPGSPEKQGAVAFLHGRWHPVIDVSIVLLGITGALIASLRWQIIGKTFILHVKTSFGLVALICAYLLHFYYRGLKRRLKDAGETEKLDKANRRTAILEKVALVCAVLAWLSGAGFNHAPW